MSVVSGLRPLLRDVTHVDLSQVSYVTPLRNAAGVVLPLALGAATGHLVQGLTVSTGALNAAFSDRPGPYHRRAGAMLLTGLGGALSAFVGGVAGGIGPLAVALTALWGFGAGLLVSLGLSATQVGLTGVLLLLIFGARPLPLGDAAATAALILGGAAFQTALSVAAWPVRRLGPRRDALAAVFRQLAAYARAREPAGPDTPPPATAEMTAARTILDELRGDDNAAAEALRTLLDEAERIRLVLLALDDSRQRLRTNGRDDGALAGQIDEVLAAAGDALSALADGLQMGHLPSGADAPLRRIEAVARGLRREAGAMRGGQGEEEDAEAMRRVRTATALARVEALGGQLRAVAEVVARESAVGAQAATREEEERPRVLRLREPLATLRANLTLHSAACRHAVRLACCLAAADALARALGLPRGYWVPLTEAIVLKPDFAATLTRGIGRVAGTILGLALATGLVYVLFGSVAAQILLVGAFMFVIRSLGPANYGLLVGAVSALVVALTALAGANPLTTIVERGIYTLIGGALALVAYAVWPTWERTQTPALLADLLDAYRRYFAAVMAGYLDPRQQDQGEMDAARQAARLARTNAEASVGRLRGEPVRSEEDLDRADGLLAASHRFAHSVMSLEAGLYASLYDPSDPIPSELRTFVDDVDATLDALAGALRDPRDAPYQNQNQDQRHDLPDLRADQRALADASSDDTGVSVATSQGGYHLAVVVAAADRIADSVNTMTALLQRPR